MMTCCHRGSPSQHQDDGGGRGVGGGVRWGGSGGRSSALRAPGRVCQSSGTATGQNSDDLLSSGVPLTTPR